MKQFLLNFCAMVYIYIIALLLGGTLKMLFAWSAALSAGWIVFLVITVGSIILWSGVWIITMAFIPARMMIKGTKSGGVMGTISSVLALATYIVNGIIYTKELVELNPAYHTKIIVLQILAGIIYLVGIIFGMSIIWGERED